MQAVVKLKGTYGEVRPVELEPPSITNGEVLVRIAAGGVCGTDVSIYKWPEAIAREYHPDFPLIMGHEFAGTVEAVGPGVKSVRKGQAVAVNPHLYCGRCVYCTGGRPVLCESRPILGCHRNGGWAELVAIPEANLYPLPDNVEPALGALMEPLSVAVHAAVERVPTTPGDTVLITGVGPIGLLHLLVARAAGARHVIITGVSQDRDRLQLAERMGGIPVNVDEQDLGAAVRRVHPLGADVAYETAGQTPALNAAIGALRKGGRLALVGFISHPSEVETLQLTLAEKELIGVRAYDRNTWLKSSVLLGDVATDLKQLVTHTLPFTEIDQALTLIQERKCIKVLIQPNA